MGDGAMTGRLRATLSTAAVAIALAGFATRATAADTYYVSVSGDDAAEGTQQKTAWRSLDRVAAQTFAAGDRLLLEGGGVFPGSIELSPANSAGEIEIAAYGPGR